MTKNLQKMAVAAAAILGLGASAVKSAEAASVKLTFFEDADTPAVAVGSFSYDESTPYEAIFPSRSVGRAPLEIKASDKWFVVQDFAVNLFGLSWNLSQATAYKSTRLSPYLWAPFDQRQVQFVTASFPPFGSGEPNLGEHWTFGDIRSSHLVILGNSDGPGSRMSWRQNDVQGFGTRSGYVIAEEVGPGGENPETVPEPATTAGLALAAAGLGYAKKKFGASKV